MDNSFISKYSDFGSNKADHSLNEKKSINAVDLLKKIQQNPNIKIKNTGNSLVTGKNVKIKIPLIAVCSADQQSDTSVDQKMTVKLKKVETVPETKKLTILYPNCSKCGEKLDNLEDFQKRMEGFASNFLMDLICVRCVRQREKVEADKRKFEEFPIEYLHDEDENATDLLEESFVVESIELENVENQSNFDEVESLPMCAYNEGNESFKCVSFHGDDSNMKMPDIEPFDEEYLSDAEYQQYLNIPNNPTEIENFYCTSCCISFKTIRHLITHGYYLHRPDILAKYICADCDSGYPSKKILQIHMNNKHIRPAYSPADFIVDSKEFKNLFECLICHKDFSRLKLLRDHTRNCNGENNEEEEMFNCNTCDTVYSSYKNLQSHIYYMHSFHGKCKPRKYRKLVRQGNTILLIIAESSDSNEHLNDSCFNGVDPMSGPNQKKRKFYCNQCCRPLKTRALQLAHEKYCQIPMKYQTKTDFYCDICKKYYNTKKLLQSHRSYKHGKSKFSTFQCRACPDTFPIRKQRLAHERSVHRNPENNKYSCADCPKEFIDIFLLEAHRFKHTNQSPFICEQCGKQFLNKSVWKSHRRAHNPLNFYKCKLCSEVFKHAATFSRHKKMHEGIKYVYCCAICQKSYVDVRDLKRHSFTHGNHEKCIACLICSQRFYITYDLKRHMRLYHNTKNDSSKSKPLKSVKTKKNLMHGQKF